MKLLCPFAVIRTVEKIRRKGREEEGAQSRAEEEEGQVECRWEEGGARAKTNPNST